MKAHLRLQRLGLAIPVRTRVLHGLDTSEHVGAERADYRILPGAGHGFLAGVILGPLPAGLNSPRGLAFGPTGDLYITDENAVLVAQF